MHLDAGSLALIGGAAFVAAIVNVVAGGGSLVSFPTLLALGYPALSANVTNTVGLIAGYAAGSVGYRRELRRQSARIQTLGIVGGAGAIAGAFLLTRTSSSLFQAMVPWLLLASCVLLALPPIATRLVTRPHGDVPRRGAGLSVGTFLSGVYAAFFGAGLGVLLLAVLALFIRDELHRLNALKGVLSLVYNAVAAVYFILFGPVVWVVVGVMVPASLAGGFAGAALARRVSPGVLRLVVILLGIAVAVRLIV